MSEYKEKASGDNLPSCNPIARASDPNTSKAGAKHLHRLRGKIALRVKRVMEIASQRGEQLTANEIGVRCQNSYGGRQESYRKRVRELVNAGQAVECGERLCSDTRKLAQTFEIKND